MNLKEIEGSGELPWGLHDACLERLDVDWIARRLIIEARVKIAERQETERRLRIVATGLVYCAIEAPEIDSQRGYDPTPTGGLNIDSMEGRPSEGLPKTPEGSFLHRFFVHDWNRSIHICAREASWEWLDAAPQPTKVSSGFHLPGDEIPDPL